MTREKVRSNHSRALDEVVALVGLARPQLVDVWDTLAVLEASGYTDARVQRELGLSDTRELAEEVYAQLAVRPLPASASTGAAVDDETGLDIRRTLVLAVGWAVIVGALALALRVPAIVLRLALVPSVVVCCGFVEAMRRRGLFYQSIGQARLGRITSWYFMRLAAFAVAAVAAAGVFLGWSADVRWPLLAFWADTFVVSSALWLLGGAMQVPGMLRRRKTGGTRTAEPDVPLPRMTVVAVRELRVLVVTAVAGLVLGVMAMSAAGYAAVGIIGGASATFVLSTMISRWSASTRPVSLS